MRRQGFHGFFKFGLAAGFLFRLSPAIRVSLLAAFPPVGAAPEINRPASDRPVDQSVIRRATVSALPPLDQGLLQEILRVSFAARLGPGKKQVTRGIGFKPGLPVLRMVGNVIHAVCIGSVTRDSAAALAIYLSDLTKKYALAGPGSSAYLSSDAAWPLSSFAIWPRSPSCCFA